MWDVGYLMTFVMFPFLEDTWTRTQGNSMVSDSAFGIDDPQVASKSMQAK